ncbi:protein-glutamate O-methyltransferase CheR, partial [Paenibacillus polymyxa]|nr:protein-glutamate O-methyltransferase CheR [Paenibacillus polymyxa]
RGANEGHVRVRPEIAEMVRYETLNLLSPSWGITEKFDVIFCRNIMIYFDKPTQAKILERFVPLMKPGGLLFAGHSENFTYISRDFRLRGQ